MERKNKAALQNSKKRLQNETSKRITTTMIGAIASIEKHLKRFWDVERPTQIQIDMSEAFEEMRTEILNKGNSQSRIMRELLDSYEVSSTRMKYTELPIRRV